MCQVWWPISEVQLKDLTDNLSDFVCEYCKIDKLADNKRIQSKFLDMSAASTTSSTFVAVQQDGSKCFECFLSCFRLFRNTKRATCVSKPTGFLLSKPTSTNSSAEKKDSTEVTSSPLLCHSHGNSSFTPVVEKRASFALVSAQTINSTTSKNPASTLKKVNRILANKPPSLHRPLRKGFVRGVSRKASEDLESFSSRILIVNGADCVVETVDLLRSYCPTYTFVFEHALRGCLEALDSIIDDILPKTIVIIQLGDIDLFQYEYHKNGSWRAKFENFITRMIEKHAFVYVSYIQSQITTDCWYNKAIQFNKVIKKISKRNNACFIDVLSKFLGQAWLFNYTGIRLNALGNDLLIREWALHITELPHLDRISQEKLSRREIISKQLYSQMVNSNDPKNFVPVKIKKCKYKTNL